ncbi:hypothetical protein IWQ62_004607 [Dispira parvispora]|uniref:Leucine-rich repeat-containing protein 40 n=1 Tax=Dispira parvispora TaxID=1520584 RepID=A0A9W8AS06_9FUNG|nr:hypothetical protein IWQ62_004607 [Dispira parvispora]
MSSRPSFRGRRTPFGTPAVDPNRIHPKLLQAARSSGQLNLANRELTVLPDEVYNLYDMAPEEKQASFSFDSSRNDGPRWWESVDLTRLFLGHNLLESLDGRIAQFPALTTVDLSNNRLTQLPPEFSQLQQLGTLNLTGNQFQTIPEVLYELPLVDLRLARNQISGWPAGHVTRWAGTLARLDLSHNQLQHLAADCSQLTSLQYLHVAHNQLTTLPERWWTGCGQLYELDVTHNQLRCLFIGSTDLTAHHTKNIRLPCLTLLDVRHNRLTSLYGQAPPPYDVEWVDVPAENLVLDFPRLKELHLSYNKLGSLGPLLLHCPELLTLELANNGISELPVGLVKLPKLMRLDLSNNELRALPNRLGLLSDTLKLLLFAGNPMRFMARRNTTESILSLLRSRLSSEELSGQLDEPIGVAKVLVLPLPRMTTTLPVTATDEALDLSENMAVKLTVDHPTSPAAIEADPVETSSPAVSPPVESPAETTKEESNASDGPPQPTPWVQPTVVPEAVVATEPLTIECTPQQVRVGKLDLSHRHLTTLTSDNLAGLSFTPQDITLAYNALTKFPVSLLTFTRLTYVDLSHNSLTQFPWWTPLSDQGLPALTALRGLNLAYNQIAEWPSLTNKEEPCPVIPEDQLPFPQLEELNLADNSLLVTAPFSLRCLFPKLTVLHLNHNRITKIPYPTAFQGLTRLSLANNAIARLPPQLGLNTSLQVLYLDGNCFRVPRHQIIRQGTSTVLEYLRDCIPK